MSGGKTATLAAGTYCFHNVTLSGGSTLAVAGPVKIVVTGKVNASGGTFVNPTHVPGEPAALEQLRRRERRHAVRRRQRVHERLRAADERHALAAARRSSARCSGRRSTSRASRPIHYDVQLVDVWASYFNQ